MENLHFKHYKHYMYLSICTCLYVHVYMYMSIQFQFMMRCRTSQSVMLHVVVLKVEIFDTMNPQKRSLITITTDSGKSDSYVAQMKRVMYGVNPCCSCVDVTHQVEPQNSLRAAFILSDIVKTFPAGTVCRIMVCFP